jgi:hypothetical protein
MKGEVDEVTDLRARVEAAIESCYAGKMPPEVMRSPQAVVVHMRSVLEGLLDQPAPPDTALTLDELCWCPTCAAKGRAEFEAEA